MSFKPRIQYSLFILNRSFTFISSTSLILSFRCSVINSSLCWSSTSFRYSFFSCCFFYCSFFYWSLFSYRFFSSRCSFFLLEFITQWSFTLWSRYITFNSKQTFLFTRNNLNVRISTNSIDFILNSILSFFSSSTIHVLERFYILLEVTSIIPILSLP